MNKRLKASLVVGGAIFLSTLGINASDIWQGLDGSLVGLAGQSQGPCGKDAVLLQFGSHAICMDTFEASPAAACLVKDPQSELQTRENISLSECIPVSKASVRPWRFVNLSQAQQLCARVGKRLPTNEEWYKAAVGMTDIEQCAIGISSNGLQVTGATNCTTPAGIHDLVGNVWEWIDGEVVDGVYSGRSLPESGYVAVVDSAGVVVKTSEEPQAEYGEDYAWTNNQGVYGIIRGGFYGSKTDAGIFTLNASVPLDFRTGGVGFRCVRDI